MCIDDLTRLQELEVGRRLISDGVQLRELFEVLEAKCEPGGSLHKRSLGYNHGHSVLENTLWLIHALESRIDFIAEQIKGR